MSNVQRTPQQNVFGNQPGGDQVYRQAQMAHSQQRNGSAKNYRGVGNNSGANNHMSTPQHINKVLIGSSEAPGHQWNHANLNSHERPTGIAGGRNLMPQDRAQDSASADLNKFKAKINGSQTQAIKKMNAGVMSSGPQPSTSTSSAGYN